jgi:RNA polymerase sigma-70 factor (sigma-E family)
MPEGTQLTADRTSDAPEGRLEELYARHAPAATRLAYLLTGDPQQAEDLVQEAFVRCVGRFQYLRAIDAFDAYLRRTIVNLHTSGMRRRRLERAWLQREGAAEASRVSTMRDVGVREDLWQALASLPPRQRAALVLRYYEDLTEQQTAQVMGCSAAAVKSLVARGGATLRERTRGDDA